MLLVERSSHSKLTSTLSNENSFFIVFVFPPVGRIAGRLSSLIIRIVLFEHIPKWCSCGADGILCCGYSGHLR